MTEPDPKTVREIARKHIRSGRTDIGTTVALHFGRGVLSYEEFAAWEYDVHKAWRVELRAVEWPDEQQPADVVTAEQQQDGAAEAVRRFADAWRDTDKRWSRQSTYLTADGTEGGTACMTEPQLRAVLAKRTALAARVAELEGEREAAAGFMAVWHDTANVQHEVDEIRCQSCRACVAGPLKSTTTLADLAVLAGRHECLPRMAAAETEES